VSQQRSDQPSPAGSAGPEGPPAGARGPAGIRRRIDTGGRTLRAFTARGVIVNTLFDLAVSLINLLRGLVLAVLVSRTDYGVWGVLVVSLGVLARLKLVGISDKYIQQEEADQEQAFQRAFTLELLVSLAAMVPIACALPLVSVIYGRWDLIAPGLVLMTVLLADALQSPLWPYYRAMDFVRQRLLSLAEPLVGFLVAVLLGLAGAGYWALAGGVVAGAWAGAILAIAKSPYPLRLRYDRGTLKLYAAFSGPIFLATVASIALANGTVIAVNARLGIAAVGAVALAGTITAFSTRVDDLVSGTLYPAICAMQDRLGLLRESFVKSNRVALMWAMPFGCGLALFAPELVRFVLGEKWRGAISLLQVSGLTAAAGHVGFNWDDYFRARGETRPIAVVSVVSAVAVLGAGIPLLLADGLTGLAIGIGVGALVSLLGRAWYLSRLFEGFRIVSHAARSVLPTLPAAALVLILRALLRHGESGPATLAELIAFGLVTAAATWRLERPLLREAIGYVIRPADVQA
jgi:O-antigen/teichoic acid export membrane protein